MRTYSVVGLGKLGASMAAAIASRGFSVVGVDVRECAVDLLNAGRGPVYETDLDHIVAENRGRLSATTSHFEAVLASDVTFVAVPTPSEDSGAFSLMYAAEAFHEIGRALAAKDDYHLVVLTSTVLPGSTRFGLLPILEAGSGKRCGDDFGLCYSPEFIALGSVIHDFLNPDFLLIGESDERAGEQLQSCYAEIVENGAPCRRMSFENAELAKIALNAYVTTKITFANMLADLCERIPRGDVDVVTDALGLDSRVGRRYLSGGLGFGGPCFPRDNRALVFLAEAVGTRARLCETTDAINRLVPDRVIERLAPYIEHGSTVAVLGLAYKPASDVVMESQALAIAYALAGRGLCVRAYDPLAGAVARPVLNGAVLVVDSLESALAGADVAVVATPDPAFRALNADVFAEHGATTVVDCWRVLAERLEADARVRYIPVGRGDHDELYSDRLAALWKVAGPKVAAAESR